MPLTTLAFGGALPSCNGSVSSKLTLPETTTLSGHQQVTETLALLATIEWQHWSRIQPSFAYNSAGQAVDATPVGFKDDWFYAIGAEYNYNPRFNLPARCC